MTACRAMKPHNRMPLSKMTTGPQDNRPASVRPSPSDVSMDFKPAVSSGHQALNWVASTQPLVFCQGTYTGTHTLWDYSSWVCPAHHVGGRGKMLTKLQAGLWAHVQMCILHKRLIRSSDGTETSKSEEQLVSIASEGISEASLGSMCPQRLWLLKPSPGNVWLMPSITTLENSWFGPMIIFRLKQTHIHIHSHYYNFTYIHSHLNALITR